MKAMRLYIALVFMVVPFHSLAQYLRLSSRAEVSVITIGPGPNYNDCFGHSAFRVKDPQSYLDRVYNYGTFDSNEPGFYTRFALGVQEYYLGAYSFKQFLGSYQAQDRWVKEQVLNLSQEEAQQIYQIMEDDLRPENKYYRYDPYFNSCGTKIRDLVVDVLGGRIRFDSSHLKENTSLRDLTHQYGFNHPWWDLGVDLALGTIMDRQASSDEHMFLPDYVFAAYENASIERNGQKMPAIRSTQVLFDSDSFQTPEKMTRPWMVFTILSLVVCLITYRDYRRKSRSRWLDFILMLLTGLLGGFMLFLWFVTSHSTTPNNLNVLWAFFPNLFMAFVLLKKNPPTWIKSYIRFLIVLLSGGMLIWFFGIQVYSQELIPVFIFLAVRYGYLWRVGLTNSSSE